MRRLGDCIEAACVSWQGLTWQQAVQWIEELPVVAGQHVSILAQHDTYGISFALEPAGQAAERQLVPLWVGD